jgi:hypothetical protein
MKRIIVALLLAALAGQVWGTVGSVISTFYLFRTVEPTSYSSGIYRDSEYVYSFFQYVDILYVSVFTPYGSHADTKGGWEMGLISYPADITRGHLGSSSAAFSIIEADEIWITNDWYNIVQSFPAQRPGGGGPGDIMWDGRYYHVHDGGGKYNLYTAAGALAGQWTVAGWPAGMWGGGSTFTKSFNNAGGRYLFVAGGLGGRDLYCAFNMDDGSLVASFSRPESSFTRRGQEYGDAYPARYGGAIWCHFSRFVSPSYHDHWAYQVDIDARGATNVVPASVGKIKAIYR